MYPLTSKARCYHRLDQSYCIEYFQSLLMSRKQIVSKSFAAWKVFIRMKHRKMHLVQKGLVHFRERVLPRWSTYMYNSTSTHQCLYLYLKQVFQQPSVKCSTKQVSETAR